MPTRKKKVASKLKPARLIKGNSPWGSGKYLAPVPATEVASAVEEARTGIWILRTLLKAGFSQDDIRSLLAYPAPITSWVEDYKNHIRKHGAPPGFMKVKPPQETFHR